MLEQSPCPRESSRTILQVLVLVLGPQVLVIVLGMLVFGMQVLVLVLVLRYRVLKNCRGLLILQTVFMYDHVKS